MSPALTDRHNVALFREPRINQVGVVDEEMLEVMDLAAMRLPINFDGDDTSPDSGFRQSRMEQRAVTHTEKSLAIRVVCKVSSLTSGRDNSGRFDSRVTRKIRIAAGFAS